MNKTLALVLWLGLAAVASAAQPNAPQGKFDPLRGPVAVNEETRPARLSTVENKDVRRTRSYAMQPPTIPHSIDNYQIDRYANRCLMCHSRAKAAESQAPPISITHYTDRDGNFLADVAPRRYFCDTCHVVQMDIRPETAVRNTYEDVESIVRRTQAAQKTAPAKK
ncbi:MAG TPA: nitrate reductase cytochrome c-type subunit [Burkholderiales bacterium]|nr:nitrate reductase cytochrome c-type subunit [Burkholderiales bacterium]